MRQNNEDGDYDACVTGIVIGGVQNVAKEIVVITMLR